MDLKEKIITSSPEQTKLLAADFLKQLKLGQRIGLVGPLGAGKTTFIQGVAEALGLKKIKSPTFVFHQPYLIKKGKFKGNFFHHFDFYRLSKGEQKDWEHFAKLFDEKGLPAGRQGLIFIEWPENLPALQKKLDWLIKFKIRGETQREIKIFLFHP